jgi:hypothetical protein
MGYAFEFNVLECHRMGSSALSLREEKRGLWHIVTEREWREKYPSRGTCEHAST